MRWASALLMIWTAYAPCYAAPAVTHYFDEAANRHATITEGDFGKVTIVFRLSGGPGVSYRWYGEGSRKESDLTFSQVVGEDQDRGTAFVAKASTTRLEVAYEPKQRMPVDSGINGSYRHISDEKRLSLAKKEAGLADDTLAQALRTAPRAWLTEDRSVAGEWKTRWPDLRNRWMSLLFKTSTPVAPSPAKPAPGATPSSGTKGDEAGAAAATADYWTALAETTGMGVGFINQPLDKTVPAWDGEYDDGFGGHVSVRVGGDGLLRFTLSCTRGSGDGQTGNLFGKLSETQLTKEKNGGFSATYSHSDSEVKPGEPQATVKLRRTGHFLMVETQHAERYCGRAWFDGIYRWGPVPTE